MTTNLVLLVRFLIFFFLPRFFSGGKIFRYFLVFMKQNALKKMLHGDLDFGMIQIDKNTNFIINFGKIDFWIRRIGRIIFGIEYHDLVTIHYNIFWQVNFVETSSFLFFVFRKIGNFWNFENKLDEGIVLCKFTRRFMSKIFSIERIEKKVEKEIDGFLLALRFSS